jgi:hypothetical protein
MSASTIVPFEIIVLVTDPVSPVVTTVPDAEGSVITVPVPAAADAIICAEPDDEPGSVTLEIPVRARLEDALLKVTAVVPMYVVSAVVARVPVVGRVTLVVAVAVRVVANAPDVVKLPPRVIVLPVFATPVPPY